MQLLPSAELGLYNTISCSLTGSIADLAHLLGTTATQLAKPGSREAEVGEAGAVSSHLHAPWKGTAQLLLVIWGSHEGTLT